MTQISHDGFARESLHRETVAPRAGQTCAWCGNRNARGNLFAYRIERDDNPKRGGTVPGLFCSISCMRAYGV